MLTRKTAASNSKERNGEGAATLPFFGFREGFSLTIQDAIRQADKLKPNTFSQEQKILWLSRVDQWVKGKIIDTHEGAEKVKFSGYDKDTGLQTLLLVPAPYDELYIHYLHAQIELAYGQEDRYNNSMDLYNTMWREFANFYNRTHMPLGRKFKY